MPPIIKSDFSKTIEDEEKIINNRNPNLKNKEFDFKNFMEINGQKLLRFREYFIKANVRDKILKRKERVSKSIKIIDSMYPNLAKNYICYFPTENTFKRIKDQSDLSFYSRRNKKRYNTINVEYNSNSISSKRKSVLFNVYNNNNLSKKKKRNMYFESVEVKKKKVDDLEYEKIYSSLLNKPDKNELVIPKVPAHKRLSFQFNLFNFNKSKLTEKNIMNKYI